MQLPMSAAAAAVASGSAPILSESSVSRFGAVATAGQQQFDPVGSLPEQMYGPTSSSLRSVASLVLSSDLLSDGEGSHVTELSGGGRAPRARGASSRMPPATAASSAAAYASQSGLTDTYELQPFPPPPSRFGEDRLDRQQSFPPPNMFTPSSAPGLRRDPSFPPPNNSGMSDMEILREQDWPMPRMTSTRGGGGGVLGRPSGGMGGGDMRGMGAMRHSEGEVPGSSSYSRFGSERSHGGPGRGGGGGGGRLRPEMGFDEGGVSVGSGEDEDVPFGEIPTRPERPDRRPSFDRLAAMIPGIPQHLQSPSSSTASATENSIGRCGTLAPGSPPSASPSTSDILQRPRGRLVARTVRARKPRDSGGRGGGSGGAGSRSSKKVMKPVSCAPSALGEPADPEKEERRRAAISRYMYKRSRRKFADSTREASPSRSRPKAAKDRLRFQGKFIKATPDFVAVTAMVGDGAEGTRSAEMPVVASQPAFAGRGAFGRDVRERGVGRSGVKNEASSSGGGGVFSESSFPDLGYGAGVPPVSGAGVLHEPADFYWGSTSMSM